jgi:hypothetical protein
MTKAEVPSAAYGRSGQFDLEEEAMPEENNNEKMSEAESTADDSRKLSEDARGLGPRQTGPFTIGLVDIIVGEGGLEVPGLVPTKYETLLLVRAWAGEILHLDFGFFLYGSVGSAEWRTREYANRRLSTIAKSIGEEEAGYGVLSNAVLPSHLSLANDPSNDVPAFYNSMLGNPIGNIAATIPSVNTIQNYPIQTSTTQVAVAEQTFFDGISGTARASTFMTYTGKPLAVLAFSGHAVDWNIGEPTEFSSSTIRRPRA